MASRTSSRTPSSLSRRRTPSRWRGLYPLPEAQLDRFLVKIHLDLPKPSELARILAATTGHQAEEGEPVLTIEEVRELRGLVREIRVSEDIVLFVAKLIHATHPDSGLAPAAVKQMVRHGASPPRGTSAATSGEGQSAVQR